MSAYHPGSFSDVYGSTIGTRLWEFVTRPDNLVRMETASYLHRPAAEVIAPALVETFGEDALTDRVKQMIGSMVRQAMEGLGYTIDRQNVRIPLERQCLFYSATRYKPRQP